MVSILLSQHSVVLLSSLSTSVAPSISLPSSVLLYLSLKYLKQIQDEFVCLI